MSTNDADIGGLRSQALHDSGECDPAHCKWCDEEQALADDGDRIYIEMGDDEYYKWNP